MELAPDGTRSQGGEPDARFEFLRAEVARVSWLVGATVGSGSQLFDFFRDCILPRVTPKVTRL